MTAVLSFFRGVAPLSIAQVFDFGGRLVFPQLPTTLREQFVGLHCPHSIERHKQVFSAARAIDLEEEGVFEDVFDRDGRRPDKAKKLRGHQESDGLIPVDWKHLQQDLHTKKQVKKQEREMQWKETCQLNDLRAQIERQRDDLLSDQVSGRGGPGNERLHAGARAHTHLYEDGEFDGLFTFDEQSFLNRSVPDLSQLHCGKWPILHMLAASGQYFFLEKILELRPEVHVEDEEGYTPLQRAVQARKNTAVSQLLKAGARVDIYDKDGANLLHLSAQVGSIHLVRVFVRHGVQVNQPDKYGYTPLHIAVLAAKDNIVRHLLVSGADRSIKNQVGLTPMDLAVALGKGFNSYAIAKSLKTLPSIDL